MGAFVCSGDGCLADAEGWTRREIELFAIVVEGPALPDRGCRGVGPPLALAESGGRRVVLLLRSVGSCGSGWMAPSFWRSRILKSRRLIWRSSWRGSISEPTFFPLAGKGEREGDLPIKQPCHSSPLFPLGQSALCRSWS